MLPARLAASLAFASLSLALAGCAEKNPITPGTYTARAAPHTGVEIAVAPDKKSVSFRLPGGAVVKRSARPWEEARWPTLCPRGMKDTSSEVLDLGPDPLQLGAARIERPVLVANCLHKPVLELMSLDAEGKPEKPEVAAFER